MAHGGYGWRRSIAAENAANLAFTHVHVETDGVHCSSCCSDLRQDGQHAIAKVSARSGSTGWLRPQTLGDSAGVRRAALVGNSRLRQDSAGDSESKSPESGRLPLRRTGKHPAYAKKLALSGIALIVNRTPYRHAPDGAQRRLGGNAGNPLGDAFGEEGMPERARLRQRLKDVMGQH